MYSLTMRHHQQLPQLRDWNGMCHCLHSRLETRSASRSDPSVQSIELDVLADDWQSTRWCSSNCDVARLTRTRQRGLPRPGGRVRGIALVNEGPGELESISADVDTLAAGTRTCWTERKPKQHTSASTLCSPRPAAQSRTRFRIHLVSTSVHQRYPGLCSGLTESANSRGEPRLGTTARGSCMIVDPRGQDARAGLPWKGVTPAVCRRRDGSGVFRT